MTAWILLTLLASAYGAPAQAWRLVAHTPAAEDARSSQARAAGASGDAAIPACHRVATGLLMCAAPIGSPQTIAMVADLAAAGTTLSEVLATHRAVLEERWRSSPAGTHSVDGLKGRYFVRAAGDGHDAAGMLRPTLLSELAQGEPVVAVPEDGTLLWWVPGDSEFDKVVAVGVRRMVDASDAPVSARIYRWNAESESWAVWGEVRGSVDIPVPASARTPSP